MRTLVKHGAWLVIAVSTFAASTYASASAAEPLKPNQLYARLLSSAPRLPSGFGGARVSPGKLSSEQRRAGAIARVDVEVVGFGPEGETGGMIFLIFETPRQARARVLMPRSNTEYYTVRGPIPGYPLPSGIITGYTVGIDAAGQKVMQGVTLLGAADGYVLVQGLSIVFEPRRYGSMPSARRFLAAARAHLRLVRGS